ncbi:BQ2448_5464 [Microbotryum intermedium]|uniref:Aminopeptidase n=1 Tax=Microbotryum intermedium TaxID=269621 RepID=A0A238F760_9BASI|nr:BQ2448_5464 [Microbotryum intermedium]
MVKPVSYALTIKTSLNESSFSGTVEIELDISLPTKCVVLHAAKPLCVLEAVLVQGGARYTPYSLKMNEEEETFEINFEEELKPGKATLGMHWTGQLSAGARFGYYKIPCQDDKPEGDHYAVTHFQPTMARRAFVSLLYWKSNSPWSCNNSRISHDAAQPCFDHPTQKATFSLTLLSPVGYVSLANSPELDRSSSCGAFSTTAVLTKDFLGLKDGIQDAAVAGWEAVRFKTTPVMSTYLVAWAVGHFSYAEVSYVSPITKIEIPLRLYAATARQYVQRGLGDQALNTLANAMPIYEKLFDIAYEYEKVDLLICDAFEAGAMENPGLITGQPLSLLHDPATGVRSSKKLVTATVAHEASHLWFGDLVSMSFWDELWLNEGTATWLGEVVVVDELEPDWNVEVEFVRTHQARALKLDGLLSSHPVHLPVLKNLPNAVAEVFDDISYEKGSTILRMLSHTIGKKAFIRGIASYLKKHAHSNTTSVDLWQAMSEASGVDVSRMMEAWTTQVGFPIVTVEEDGQALKLRQNRFLASGPASEEFDQTIWTLPLGVRELEASNEFESSYMSTRDLEVPKPLGLFIVNREAAGFYRVSYSPSHLTLLASEAISPTCRLSLSERLALLQDVIALSSSGHTRTSSALSFIRTLASTTDAPQYFLWHEIAEALGDMLDTWWEQSPEVQEGIKRFARSLLEPLLDRIGWTYEDGDSTERKSLKSLVVGAAFVAEVPAAIGWARTSFQALLASQAGPDSLIIDLAPLVLSTAVKHGSSMEFDIVQQIYHQPPTPFHQMGAIIGLTSSSDPDKLVGLAQKLSTGEIPIQDVPLFLGGLARNPHSRRLVWSVVSNAWPLLRASFDSSSSLYKVLEVSIQGFSSTEDVIMIETFFKDENLDGFAYALGQGLEKIRSKAGWLSRDGEDVESWLRGEGYMS